MFEPIKILVSLFGLELDNRNYKQTINTVIILSILAVFAISIQCVLLYLKATNPEYKYVIGSEVYIVGLVLFFSIISSCVLVSKLKKYNTTKSMCDGCTFHKITTHFDTSTQFTNPDIEEYFIQWLKSVGHHNEFVERLREKIENNRNIKDLNIISEDVKKSDCGRFLCSIGNLDFLDSDQNSIQDMTDYFFNFKDAADHNYIVRMFNVPGVISPLKHEKPCKMAELPDKNHSLALLRYLIINCSININTRILFYSKDDSKIGEMQFNPRLDYVLASPMFDKNINKSISRLYLASKNNKVLVTEDSLLISLFNKDFVSKKIESEENTPNYEIVDFPYSAKANDEYDRILKLLDISEIENNQLVDDLIKDLDRELTTKYEERIKKYRK